MLARLCPILHPFNSIFQEANLSMQSFIDGCQVADLGRTVTVDKISNRGILMTWATPLRKMHLSETGQCKCEYLATLSQLIFQKEWADRFANNRTIKLCEPGLEVCSSNDRDCLLVQLLEELLLPGQELGVLILEILDQRSGHLEVIGKLGLMASMGLQLLLEVVNVKLLKRGIGRTRLELELSPQ